VDDARDELDEDPVASSQLCEAAERGASRWTTDQDRLTRVRELLGQLNRAP